MKNKILKKFIILFFFFLLMIDKAYTAEQFNFDVTEVQILENGNKFVGIKRGLITTDDGIEIDADQFEYYKNSNILNASGNVKIFDTINNYEIYTDKITYKKNEQIIITNNNSKAISLNDGVEINSANFEYNISKNIITAERNVIIEDKVENYIINSEFLKYFRNEEKIITEGRTSAKIKSKYNIKSKNSFLLRNLMKLSSNENTSITDKSNLYNLSKFVYYINKEELRGEKIFISSNHNLPKTMNFIF